MQKARRHPVSGTPTACRRTVSGSLSPRCSRCFSPFPHGTRSLSVLQEYLALPDGPGGFGQGSSCPALLRVPPSSPGLRVRGSHPLRPRIPAGSASPRLALWRPYYPRPAATGRVWAPPLSLATTRGITVVFSSSAYLDVSVRRVRPPLARGATLRVAGCPIRVPRDRGPCAPPPGFSQLAAPFLASGSLGIPHAPLLTSPARAPGSRRPAHQFFPLCSRFSRSWSSVVFLLLCHHVKELPLWRMSESNRRPPACKAGALAN